MGERSGTTRAAVVAAGDDGPDGDSWNGELYAVGPDAQALVGQGDAVVRQLQVEGRELTGCGDHLDDGDGADAGCGRQGLGKAGARVDAQAARVLIVVGLEVRRHLEQEPAARASRMRITDAHVARSQIELVSFEPSPRTCGDG